MEQSAFLWRRLQLVSRLTSWSLPLLFGSALMLALVFQGSLGKGPVWFWFGAVAATALVVGTFCWFLRKPSNAVLSLATGFVAGTLALALEWAWFLAAAYEVLPFPGRAIVAAAAALLLATGTLALAAHLTASAVWFVGISTAFAAFGLSQSGESALGWLSVLPLTAALGLLVLSLHRRVLARFKAEAQTASLSQLVSLLLHDFGEDSQDWLWETDAQGRLRAVGPQLARQLARPASELEGQPLVQAIVADPGQLTIEEEEDLAALSRSLLIPHPFHDLEVPVQSDGYHRWRLSAKPLKDDHEALIGWMGVGTDITEVQRINNLNARLALLDNLTGMANRHRFQEVLHDQLTPRTAHRPLGLVLIDLQNFRMVNEGLGNEVGDNLLREVASRLRNRVPTSSLLARLGGDEFALLTPGAGEAGIEGMTAAILSAAEEPFHVEGHRLEVSFHLGWALAPRDARGSTELLKCAELALHEAKLSRIGAPVSYQPELGERAQRRIRLQNELKTALLEGQFELNFQPQIRTVDGVLAGSEALVRWRHPVRGLVSPAEFIPALEETGLIVPVGMWILEAACREALNWPAEERVAVNVSAVQFASRTFLDSVRKVLETTGFPPGRLELEITESVMAQDPKQVIQILTELRTLGIVIALDDFGTGYSSLSYLRQLPLDSLKVDQSFVRALDLDQNAAAIVQTVLELSRALGLKTTAEGVETEAQRAQLVGLGVDHIQGYFYSKPVPAAELTAFRKGRKPA